MATLPKLNDEVKFNGSFWRVIKLYPFTLKGMDGTIRRYVDPAAVEVYLDHGDELPRRRKTTAPQPVQLEKEPTPEADPDDLFGAPTPEERRRGWKLLKPLRQEFHRKHSRQHVAKTLWYFAFRAAQLLRWEVPLAAADIAAERFAQGAVKRQLMYADNELEFMASFRRAWNKVKSKDRFEEACRLAEQHPLEMNGMRSATLRAICSLAWHLYHLNKGKPIVLPQGKIASWLGVSQPHVSGDIYTLCWQKALVETGTFSYSSCFAKGYKVVLRNKFFKTEHDKKVQKSQ